MSSRDGLEAHGTRDLTLAVSGFFMSPSVADEEGDGRDDGRTWGGI